MTTNFGASSFCGTVVESVWNDTGTRSTVDENDMKKSKDLKGFLPEDFVDSDIESDGGAMESEVSTLKYHKQPMPKGEQLQKCWVSYCVSMREFYVQLAENTCAVERFGSAMQHLYNSSVPPIPPGNLCQGLACVALYQDDKNYYRAKILAVGTEDCFIKFIDYGNESWISNTEILPLKKQFGKFPPAAYQCCFIGHVAWRDRMDVVRGFRQKLLNEEGDVVCLFEKHSTKRPHLVRLFDLNCVEMFAEASEMSPVLTKTVNPNNSDFQQGPQKDPAIVAAIDRVFSSRHPAAKNPNSRDVVPNPTLPPRSSEKEFVRTDEGFITALGEESGIVVGRQDISYPFHISSLNWIDKPIGVSDLRNFWRVDQPVVFRCHLVKTQWQVFALGPKQSEKATSSTSEASPESVTVVRRTTQQSAEADRFGFVSLLDASSGSVTGADKILYRFTRDVVTFDGKFVQDTLKLNPFHRRKFTPTDDGLSFKLISNESLLDHLKVSQPVRYVAQAEASRHPSLLSVMPLSILRTEKGVVQRLFDSYGFIEVAGYGDVFFLFQFCKYQADDVHVTKWLKATVEVVMCAEVPGRNCEFRAIEVRLLQLNPASRMQSPASSIAASQSSVKEFVRTDEGFITALDEQSGIVVGRQEGISYSFHSDTITWIGKPTAVTDLHKFWRVEQPVTFQRRLVGNQWQVFALGQKRSEKETRAVDEASEASASAGIGATQQSELEGFGSIDRLNPSNGSILTADRASLLRFNRNAVTFDDHFVQDTRKLTPLYRQKFIPSGDGHSFKLIQSESLLNHLEVNQTVRWVAHAEASRYSRDPVLRSVMPLSILRMEKGVVQRLFDGYGFIYVAGYGDVFFLFRSCKYQAGEVCGTQWLKASVEVVFCSELPGRSCQWRAIEVRLLQLNPADRMQSPAASIVQSTTCSATEDFDDNIEWG